MHLRSLYLQGFRNYQEACFEFVPGLNLLAGPNGQGKTNVLEAIHYLMVGRSFRPCHLKDFIHREKDHLYVEALFCKYGIDQKLSLYMQGKERRICYNHTLLSTLSHLFGLIQGVIMTPDDAQLIKGSPPLRRQFLDLQLAQADPLYIHHLIRYTRAMRQRNQLLKEKRKSTLESWEHEMASSASYLVLQRRNKLQALQVCCERFYAILSGEQESLRLTYCSKAADCKDEEETKQFHLQHYKKNREREMLLGFTLVGPHKDDILIELGGQDIRYFASEGQQRSCIAALRLGEWEHLKQTTEELPLLMIDDVGISLDEKRRQRLLEQLLSLGQVFLTATDPALVQSFEGNKKIFLLPII